MSEERKARIRELEVEAEKLRSQERADHDAAIKARVETLFQGLHLSDVPIVQRFVDEQRHRLWVVEGDDDE